MFDASCILLGVKVRGGQGGQGAFSHPHARNSRRMLGQPCARQAVDILPPKRSKVSALPPSLHTDIDTALACLRHPQINVECPCHAAAAFGLLQVQAAGKYEPNGLHRPQPGNATYSRGGMYEISPVCAVPLGCGPHDAVDSRRKGVDQEGPGAHRALPDFKPQACQRDLPRPRFAGRRECAWHWRCKCNAAKWTDDLVT